MKTARLIVTTQYYENYGAHDWDGKGECPQYWKPKFGSEYMIAEVTVNEAIRGEAYLQSVVDAATPFIEKDDDLNREYVIGWSLYWDGELTETEELHKSYDGDCSNVVHDAREEIKNATMVF